MASPDKTPEEIDLEKQKSLESPLGPPRNAEPLLADPDRLRLCQELVAERPYSHPVATGWYAEDVPKLLARVRELTEQRDNLRRDVLLIVAGSLKTEMSGKVKDRLRSVLRG